MAKSAWKEDYKGMKYQKDKYNDDESKAWALIYDQCSPELKDKLGGTKGYDRAKASNNVIRLLTMISGYCCQFDILNYEYMSIAKPWKNLLYFFQKTKQSNSDFHKEFMALVEVIEEYVGAGLLIYFTDMIKKELSLNKLNNMSKATPKELKEAKVIIRDTFFSP